MKKRIGSRFEVINGKAIQTSGGLKKKNLKYNKLGKIVSKKASKSAKKSNNLGKFLGLSRKTGGGCIGKPFENINKDFSKKYITLCKKFKEIKNKSEFNFDDFDLFIRKLFSNNYNVIIEENNNILLKYLFIDLDCNISFRIFINKQKKLIFKI